MRKHFISLVVLLAALGAQASTVDVMTSYIYSSDYNQARVGASVPLGGSFRFGAEGKYVEDKIATEKGGLKNPVYSVYLPLQLELENIRLALTPFYYFENKSEQDPFQDASAYGLSAQLVTNLVKDDVGELYTQAFVEAAYARQKGTVLKDETDQWNNQYYDQTAFTLGLRQNFYNAFLFQVSGTAFQYPDGISNVKNFRGILDQKDLAFVQSYDVSRALGKYVVAARLTRMWQHNHSSVYAGYHYAEFYTADPQHSFLIGNTFYLWNRVFVDMAYNHLQTSHNTNKRDLFFVNLNISF